MIIICSSNTATAKKKKKASKLKYSAALSALKPFFLKMMITAPNAASGVNAY